MMKASAQKTLQDFYFLLFTFVSGFFYFCFYLISITFALVMTIIFWGIPLLAWVLQTTQTFVQYERIQTKVYTDISIDLFEPRKKEERDKWIIARDIILNNSNWRAIFWLMQKIFVGIMSLICAVLLYVMPIVCIVTPLLFQYFNIYLLGIAVNSWETAIFVMIVGFILIWIHNLIGNDLVRIIGMYTRFMFKAIKE
ncbi:MULTISPECIES: sensor domain-containing protein [Bacillus cereus group]|uniref:sensor domain-containing protein n=1 Tax=Bacillus cereus group TaxID=86661 RepID=UPI000BECBFDC|nr:MULTISPECIES: sensor domain-containing protein [Bacillus cereus group]PDZ30717.1 histidine kinase [Bacillus toyonensis]PEI54723.1 histidine kinase [Bacillus toyonensis]PEJ10955.1 histidine kinase [Bacillus toyonensis]PEK46101.1 histidine kinase [Bacillus toyonensis]PEO35800.1 histidine kinase [Bacillus toyonensis]